MRRWGLGLALVAVAALGGLAVWYQINRVHFVQTLCEAGLPNLSRPSGVDAERLECVVVGPKRRVSGFLVGAYHGRTLVVGEALRFDDQGHYANEVFDVAGGTGRSASRWSELREMGQDAPEGCFLTVWGVTLDGWSTETDGPYGWMGLPSRGFYVDRIVSIRAVEPEQVTDLDERMRASVCAWTGRAGWRRLGSELPTK